MQENETTRNHGKFQKNNKEGKRFSSTYQPSPEQKSAGWAEKASREKIAYTVVDSFNKLKSFQEEAIAACRYELAAKIEDQLCKLMGFYVEKVAQTDSDGNDKFEPPVINILPVRVKDDYETDDNAGEDAVSSPTEEQV